MFAPSTLLDPNFRLLQQHVSALSHELAVERARTDYQHDRLDRVRYALEQLRPHCSAHGSAVLDSIIAISTDRIRRTVRGGA